MKTINIRIIILAITFFALTGCNNNPFPEGGKFSEKKEDEHTFPPIGLQFSPVMELREGEHSEFEIKATGGSSISVLGLPNGAIFDASTNKIIWTPTNFDGNDPAHPELDSRTYPIKIRLFSPQENNSVLERDAVLLVRDVPRTTILWGADSSELREGAAFSQDIVVANEDFTNTEVLLYMTDLPSSASVERNASDPSRYRIRYTPAYNFVTQSGTHDSLGFYRDLTIHLFAVTPRGQIVNKDIHWRVRDQRQTPLVVGPLELTANSEISFTINAQDPNLEDMPRIRLVSRPPFGQLTVDSIPQTSAPANAASVLVRWFDLPPTGMQGPQTLVFSVCTGVAPTEQCLSHTVNVTFNTVMHAAPLFDRAAWPLGTIKQIHEGENLSFALPIRIVETQMMATNVVIEKSQNNADIAWSEGVLTINGKTAGLLQFNIVATSPFGVSQKESMLVEVVPVQPPTNGGRY